MRARNNSKIPAETNNLSEFWTLWLGCEKNLRKKCIQWTCGCIDQAEDIMGITMMKALSRSSVQIEQINNFYGWILSIAYHVFIDLLREQKKHISAIDDLESFIAENISADIKGAESVEDMYLRKETLNEILSAINTLPDHLRTITVLRLLFEMPYKDISSQMNLGNANVRKRYQQARLLLQKEINNKNPESYNDEKKTLISRKSADSEKNKKTGNTRLLLYLLPFY